jgi:mycothiol system anti-sigma-R factor
MSSDMTRSVGDSAFPPKPSKPECDALLERVYFFIDNELEEADSRQIREHIAACAPCLEIVDLERIIKALLARSCTERAPAALRQRVVFEIRQIQIGYTTTE